MLESKQHSISSTATATFSILRIPAFIGLNSALPGIAEIMTGLLGSCLMEGVWCSLSQFSPIQKLIYFKNTFSTGIFSGVASALGEHESWSHLQPVGKILKGNICLLSNICISLNDQCSSAAQQKTVDCKSTSLLELHILGVSFKRSYSKVLLEGRTCILNDLKQTCNKILKKY